MNKIINSIGFLGSILFLNTSFASFWQQLWHTPNQIAQQFMNQKDYKNAEKWFKQVDWQAVAAYRANHYKKASTQFEALGTADGFYNQGNALAKLGQYKKAIVAYDKALVLNKENKDAQFNRQLIKKLLEQSKESEKSSVEDRKQSNENKASQKKIKKPNKDASQKNNSSTKKNHQPKDEQRKEENSDDKKASSLKRLPTNNKGNIKPKIFNKNLTPEQAKQAEEKLKASQRWLNLIPDEPGGLLREKFLRDYYRRHQED